MMTDISNCRFYSHRRSTCSLLGFPLASSCHGGVCICINAALRDSELAALQRHEDAAEQDAIERRRIDRIHAKHDAARIESWAGKGR